MSGLMIGGPVWGDAYADIFERYCLASMRGPANLAALQANGATLQLHTDEDTLPRIEAMVKGLGFDAEVKLLTRNDDSKYGVMARVHAQQVTDCVRDGRPFHMLVSDQIYSANYFPRLFELAAEHGNLIHSGICAKSKAAGNAIDLYRDADGSLSLSATQLGCIAWEHRHNRLSQFVMNDGEWPDFHMHLWRASDRAMIFCPHNSPIYLLPETGKALGATATTLDAMAHLIGDYYAPTFEDDMTLANIDCTPEYEQTPRVGWDQFAERGWGQAKSVKSLNRYYRQTTAEVAIPLDEDAPSAAAVLGLQASIVDRMVAFVSEKGWAHHG